MQMKKFLPLLLLLLSPLAVNAQLTTKGKEQQINYSGSTAGISFNTPAQNFLLNTGVNTFIMTVNPNNVARIYLSNETSNACANFTVSVGSTSQTQATTFNNNTQIWQPIQSSITGGALANSTPVTIPALGTVTVTTATILGNRIVIFVVLSAGCATTNIDFTVIFGSTTIISNGVQGLVPVGNPASGTNPFLMAGKNAIGNVSDVNVCGASPDDCAGFNLTGIALGGQNVGLGSTFNQYRMPAGSADGVLAVGLMATDPSGTTPNVRRVQQTRTTGCGSASASCDSLWTADSGYVLQNNGTPLTIFNPSTTVALWGNPNTAVGFANSVVETCMFSVKSTNNSGTVPTLDAYVQDSEDGQVFNDRIHFTQFTTGTQIFLAGIAGTSSNYAVAAPTTGTIPAGTIVSGPLGSYGQFRFVTGGTSPNYTVIIGVSCK
jgi:hypothetical protein